MSNEYCLAFSGLDNVLLRRKVDTSSAKIPPNTEQSSCISRVSMFGSLPGSSEFVHFDNEVLVVK